jgi:4,5-DOPA dioxygenase extradiol
MESTTSQLVAPSAGFGTSGKKVTLAPSTFLAHGSPYSLFDQSWQMEMAALADTWSKPKSILIISAHWETRGFQASAIESVPLVYDYFGFPESFYQVTYPAPPAPSLAQEVESLLQPLGPLKQTRRGLDHGSFTPLRALYPAADIPVLQLSLPSSDPQMLLAMGEALRPLRDHGTLILAAGYLVHNLGLPMKAGAEAPAWLLEFDAWVAKALQDRDWKTLINFRREAPHFQRALPTVEHFLPLFVAMGASHSSERISFPQTGFEFGTFTRRAVRWS